MTADHIRDEYFEYLYQIVCGEDIIAKLSWRSLLWHLFNTPFRISYIQMDENRARDGINMRYRFGDDAQYPRNVIYSCLGDDECSVLEMMIALAIRMEDEIMASSEFGDHTSLWFWSMIGSLGLNAMTDFEYNFDDVEFILDRFMDREYGPDGEGGLFYIPECQKDLRHIEIWYQMCEYLNNLIAEGRE